MRTSKDSRDRKRLVRAIAQLNDQDFGTVMYYLLGDSSEREAALKILGDLCPQREL